VGVDPVLWQQAVEAAAKALAERFRDEVAFQPVRLDGQIYSGHDEDYYREIAALMLAAAFGVLQQATLHQLAALTNVGGAPYRATMWLDWAAAQFGVELHTDARPDRPLPGETPKEDAG